MWAVRFEGVTKRYRLQRTRYRSLRADLSDLVRRGVGRSPVAPRDEMTALDHLDLEIEAGVTSAIVGRNGAGKSTALRLISRITYPTEGRVRVRGRVGALIEVGAGVHPELSGRENIGLYGSFLGFSRADIRRRFDDIVDFAEIHEAVDIPVKYYSTGMKLRLGFAIASYLEPAVLIVDESLAVGDGAFQAKCVGRMHELGSNGTTVVFVSHELAAVETLCQHGIWLEHGRLVDQGPIGDILRAYGRSLHQSEAREIGHDRLDCVRVATFDRGDHPAASFRPGDPMRIDLTFHGPHGMERPQVQLRITDGVGDDLIECVSPAHVPSPVGTSWTARCRVESIPLNPRLYQIWCRVSDPEHPQSGMDWREVGAFRIEQQRSVGHRCELTSIGVPPVAIETCWSIEP
jgi:ABC-type polysaccharide/polyol phosphate transport system ATPase subunit